MYLTGCIHATLLIYELSIEEMLQLQVRSELYVTFTELFYVVFCKTIDIVQV